MARDKDDLWRNFPKTAIESDRRFATEEACRTYWIEARWGGEPACARCGSKGVWAERGGFLFECGDCDHQTSLTSGTLLEKTRKPFKVWFRAVFEISSSRPRSCSASWALARTRRHGAGCTSSERRW